MNIVSILACMTILQTMPFDFYHMLGIGIPIYHRMPHVEGLEVVKCAKHEKTTPKNNNSQVHTVID